MSISKEKQLILKIKEILSKDNPNHADYNPDNKLSDIQELVDSYEDPGYITGPIVGVQDDTPHDYKPETE